MADTKTKLNPNIHGLRGLASFFVLIYHIYRGAITAESENVHGYNFWPYPAFLATQVVMFTVGTIIGWSWMINLSVADYLYFIVVNILFLPGVFNFNIALPAAWTLSFEALFYCCSGYFFFFACD